MKEQFKEFEIPFGAKDNELCGWEYTIPEGMEATIVDNKIVVKKKESEDEKIRKEMIAYMKHPHSEELFPKAWIDWLEKQGEHANFLNKIQIGDKVTRNKDGMLVNLSQLDRIAKKDEKQGEQKTASWSEEDENHVKSILSTIECCKAQFPNAQSVVEAYNADIEWFISLKDRYTWKPSELPHWKKSNLPNDNTTGFNSDYFCHNGYCINYKELFEKLPKDD